jgi:hypothetical protein
VLRWAIWSRFALPVEPARYMMTTTIAAASQRFPGVWGDGGEVLRSMMGWYAGRNVWGGRGGIDSYGWVRAAATISFASQWCDMCPRLAGSP